MSKDFDQFTQSDFNFAIYDWQGEGNQRICTITFGKHGEQPKKIKAKRIQEKWVEIKP